jgi:hypothetical protein
VLWKKPSMALSSGWSTFVAIAALTAVVDLATKSAIFSLLGMPGERPGIVLVSGML